MSSMSGVKSTGGPLFAAAAIAWAITRANEADIVLIAGKGHENYQQIGTENRSFSDYVVAEAALAAAAKRSAQ